MQQLIYVSKPVRFDAQTLQHILATSRRNNRENDITGALVVRKDVYVQLLEGPWAAVDQLLQNLLSDDRHENVQVLVRCPIADRLFSGWSMKHDPAQSWLWSARELQEGAAERATVREVREIFVRVQNACTSHDF